MVDTTDLELETARGSRLLGVLGAFLGALVGTEGWYTLMFFTARTEYFQITILGAAAVSFCSCWGYRLFRGYRSMKFARWAVRICIVLAQPVAMIGTWAPLNLLRRYGTVHADILYSEMVHFAEELIADSQVMLVFLGWFSLLSLLFSKVSWGILLKYADPAWYHDPRRVACTNGGGATFNALFAWPLPPAEEIPHQFEVDNGKLTVEGSTITLRQRFKAPLSFSVQDVAGVVLGPGNGFNVLYDRNRQVLAKFAWSRKGAETFGQYLLHHGIPFTDPSGQPVSSAPSGTPAKQATVVKMPAGLLSLSLFSGLLFGFGTPFFWLILPSRSRGIALLFLLLAVFFFWCFFSYRNWALAIEGSSLRYTSPLGRTVRLPISQIGSLRYKALTATWEILDHEGAVLARYKENMKNAAAFTSQLRTTINAR